MNRYFHSWECKTCDTLGCVEVFGLIYELPETTTCSSCGSKNLDKMSNHLNNQPTSEHLKRVKSLKETNHENSYELTS